MAGKDIIASGAVEIDLQDASLIAGLERANAKFKKTMDDMGRQRAVADVEINLKELERQVQKAKLELKKLEGEQANPHLRLDDDEFEKQYEIAKAKIARLDGERADVELRVKGSQKFLHDMQAAADATHRQEEAERSLAMTRDKLAKDQQKLNEKATRQYAQSHAEALRMNRERSLGAAQEAVEINKLQREYARLTDKMEVLDKKRKRPALGKAGKEARAKLELDTAGVDLQMKLVKERLNFLGGHPPVDIKANIDERGLRRVGQILGNLGGSLGNKLGGLADLTVRLGPFTASIRQLGLALSFLGPMIVDVAGAAGALVGVVGAGIAGAAAVGAAGVAGLGAGFLGLKFTLRNTGQEIANARTAINALQKAQEKGDPKKIAKAQKDLNNTLKNISPLAREAALGIERFYSNWDKHTHASQNNLGDIAKNGFHALNKITPMWAHSTNQLTRILDKGLRGGFKFIEGGEFHRMFSTITGNFNSFLTPVLHGFGSLGIVIGRITESASKLLPAAGRGFANWASGIEKSVQPGEKLDSTIKRLGNDARDTGRFLMAMGRLLVTIFGGGEPAGAQMLNNMTDALNRWNDTLKENNKAGLHKFFGDSVKGATDVFHALAPMIAGFVKWSAELSPVFTLVVGGLLQAGRGAAYVARAFSSLLSLIPGLNGSTQALAVTLGSLWAVGKIGAAVAMLGRFVALLKEAAAAGTLMRGLATGSILAGAMSGPARLAQTAAPVAEGVAVGRTAEKVTAGALGAKAAAKASSAFALVRGAVAGASEAFLALGPAGRAGAVALGALAAAATALGVKSLFAKDASKQVADAIKAQEQASGKLNLTTGALNATAVASGTTNRNLHDSTGRLISLKRELLKLDQEGKKNTSEYDSKLQQFNSELQNHNRLQSQAHQLAQGEIKLQNQSRDLLNKQASARKLAQKATDDYNKAQRAFDKNGGGDFDKLTRLQQNMNRARREAAAATRAATAANIQHAASLVQESRAYNHMAPLDRSAQKAVAGIAGTHPNLAFKIGFKYPAPSDVTKVAGVVQNLLNAGAKTPKITAILNAKDSASTTVRKLKALLASIHSPKSPKLNADGSPARSVINKTMGSLRAFGSYHPPTVHLSAEASAVKAAIASATSAILAFGNRTFPGGHIAAPTVAGPPSRTNTHGWGYSGGVFAQGGMSVKRAAWRTAGKDPQRTRGGRYSKPTLLVGEETRNEYVIATNPAYRKNNLKYLAGAASELGMHVVEAAAKGKGYKAPPERTGSSKYDTSKAPPASNPGFYPKPFYPQKTGKTKTGIAKHGIAGKLKLQLVGISPAAKRVGEIQVDESRIRSEIGLQQRQLGEVTPDTFLISTGKVDLGGGQFQETFAINDKALAAYNAQAMVVEECEKNLLAALAEEVRLLPRAVNESHAIRARSAQNIHNLTKEQSRLTKQIQAAQSSKSKKDNKSIPAWRTRLKQVNAELKRENKLHDGAAADEDALKGRLPDAGFEYRDASFDLLDTEKERKAANDQATTDLAASKDSGGGSGGGDGGSGGTLSYGEQSALADSQKAQVLRDFGSNFSPNVGSIGGPAGTDAPGMQPNSASGPAVGSMSDGMAGGAAAGSMMQSTGGGSSSAAAPNGSSSGTSAAGSGAGPGADSSGNTVNVTNNYAAPPPDPHTWSKGMAYEIGAAV